MDRQHRLRRQRDIDRVYREGRVFTHPLLTLRVRPNECGYPRLAVVAGKRLGKAVVRNRVRRRLREALRQLPLQPGHDLLVVARPPAAKAPFAELVTALRVLLARARLLGGSPLDRPMAAFPP
ncbi:MAG: ribonuclease P protein component [Chloroflexi bacterium]|nr:ribonuclease P protein component [Chloroflexota bacterium]